MRIRAMKVALRCPLPFFTVTAFPVACGGGSSGPSIEDGSGAVISVRVGRPLASNTIVFVSSRAHDRSVDQPGYTDIFSMDGDGGNVVQLTFRDLPEPYGYEHAAI